MNALNLSLRCAALYTDGINAEKMSADDELLFADALTSGIADYWSLAPKWVTDPSEGTALSTVASTATVTLPMHFEQLNRPPRIRRTSTEEWRELAETIEPLLPATLGAPMQFRIRDRLTDTPAWNEATNDGNTVARPTIVLYPTPDAIYSLDIQARYHSPRIRPIHLRGRDLTVDLPIPDHHLVSMVVPLCAPHFLLFPKKKASLTDASANAAASRGLTLLTLLPQRRSTRRSNVGTPLRY